MEQTAKERSLHDPVSPARLVAFSDGVFAIAVTLLVFNLKVPEIPPADVHRLLRSELHAMMPRFETYLLSFILIAFFWTIHHRMLDLIVRANYALLWINNLYLLAISFLPFPTSLVGTYPDELISFLIYLGSIFLVVGLSQWLWWCANRHRLLSQEIRKPMVRFFFYRGLTTTFILLLSMFVSMFSLRWGRWMLLLVLPAHWILSRVLKKRL